MLGISWLAKTGYLLKKDCALWREYVYPMHWMGLMMICGGMAVRRMGMLGVSVINNEGADCEDVDSDGEW